MKKVFLVGLSAGGMLAYNIACKSSPIAGLIVTNLLDNRLEIVRQYSAKIGLQILSQMPNFIKKIKIPVSMVTNMKGLVNDKKILNVLIKDKRGAGNNVQINFLLTMMNHIPEIEPESFKNIPVLMCHPGNDKWTPVEISELFFDRIQAKKKKVILENCGHFPLEYPGKTTLENLQDQFNECVGSFCGYGVAVKNFKNPIIDFNKNNTYIQKKGITQDFGIYDSPDDLLKEHHQEISKLKAFLYKIIDYIRVLY